MTMQHLQQERRQFGRRTSNRVGHVKVPGRGTLTCLVENLTRVGALLIFAQPETLPFCFVLDIDGYDQPFGCEVRHHRSERVGVSFMDVEQVHEAMRPRGGELANWSKPRRLPATQPNY